MHNQRLAKGILAAVALFVAIVVVVLIVKGGAVPPDPVDRATKADYRIKEVHLREEARGGVAWQLDADQAEAFEQLGKTILRKVRITIDEPDRSWRVTSDEGEMAQANKDVELRGNVVLTSSEGFRLETTKLFWTADQQRAWTDTPVTVYRSGAVVRGRGIDARVADRTTAIKGPVHAVFSTRSAAPDRSDAQGSAPARQGAKP